MEANCIICGAGCVDHDNSSATVCIKCKGGRFSSKKGVLGTCAGVCDDVYSLPGSTSSRACVAGCGAGKFYGDGKRVGQKYVCALCPSGKYDNDHDAGMYYT